MELDKKILSDIIIYTKYARYIPEEKRRETWDEIVNRNMNMHIAKFPFLETEIRAVYERSVRPRKLLPSARSLQFAGKAIDVNNTRIFNCAYLPINHPDAFSESAFLLLGGSGVGFSIQKHHIGQLPPIMGVERPTAKQHKRRYLVADSIEGWADAFKVLVESYFYGKREIDFDFRSVRHKGTRLVTAGGKAPGPEPLRRALVQLIAIFETALQERGTGAQLTSLEVHDIVCSIADAVRSGGIRRSALISLFDRDDDAMLSCKHGEWWVHHGQRALANNSAVMPYSEISEAEFFRIWKAVEASGCGEPGISWTNNKDLAYNPCFSGDTLIHTSMGPTPIKDLVGKTVKVYDGSTWVSVSDFRVTGENQDMLKIELQDGSIIRTTSYHTFILEDGTKLEAKELRVCDKLLISTAPHLHGTTRSEGAYLKGFLIGDGTHTKDRPLLYVYGPKFSCLDRLKESALDVPIEAVNTNALEDVGFIDNNGVREAGIVERKTMRGLSVRKEELLPYVTIFKETFPIEVFGWDLESKLEFIAGIMDSDGGAHDTFNGWMYQLSSIHKSWLLGFQTLLKSIGVYSKVTQYKDAVNTDFGDGYGVYPTKDAFRLTISQGSSIVLASQVRFSRLVSFANKQTKYLIKPKWNTIVDITEDGVDERVYCCTVPTNHTLAVSIGIQTGQCHEISLKPHSFCNLSEINGSVITTQEEFNQVSRDGAFLGTLQASYTNFHYLRSVWRDTSEDESLIGVGITGVACASLLALDEAQAAREAVKENIRVASLIGINPAKRVTTIKPAGTTSVLYGCSSGIHAWHNDYYIRRITLGKDEAVAKYLSEMHPEIVEQSEYDPKEIKVVVPQKSPEGAMLRTEDVLETLERVKRFNLNWVRAGHVEGENFNNVSTTISVKDGDWPRVGGWMWDNRYNYHGIAVLPYNGGTYKQAPFEDITKERYEELMKNLVDVDLRYVVEVDDETNMVGEVACGGGGCAIV